MDPNMRLISSNPSLSSRTGTNGASMSLVSEERSDWIITGSWIIGRGSGWVGTGAGGVGTGDSSGWIGRFAFFTGATSLDPISISFSLTRIGEFRSEISGSSTTWDGAGVRSLGAGVRSSGSGAATGVRNLERNCARSWSWADALWEVRKPVC